MNSYIKKKEMYYVFETKKNGASKGRAIIKEETLLKLIDFVKKGPVD